MSFFFFFQLISLYYRSELVYFMHTIVTRTYTCLTNTFFFFNATQVYVYGASVPWNQVKVTQQVWKGVELTANGQLSPVITMTVWKCQSKAWKSHVQHCLKKIKQ